MRQSKYPVLLAFFVTALVFGFSWMEPADAQIPQGFTWVRIASQPRPNGEAQSVVLNGKLYSFSGFAPCCTPMRRVYSYDPKEDVWVRLADVPKGITHAGMATDGVRYIYIAGGYPENPAGGSIFGTNEVWRYDSVTNTYQAMPSLPARNGTAQLVYLDGKLHFIGGQTPDTRIEDLDTHWVLNVAGGATSWTNAAPLPVPRQHAAAVALGGQIYYIGGQKNHDANLVPQNALHRYNPATNTWTALAPMPGVGRNHTSASTLVINGKIVVFGGQTYNYQLVDDITEYDPATNTWREVGKLFAPRASAIAGIIDGVVYYATGSSASSYKGYTGAISPIKIENFTLVDAAEDYPVAVLRDGSTIDISALPSSLSIGIVFSGWPVGSVVMGWNGNPRYRVENGAPFAYYDNSGTDYAPGPIPLGENVLTATPYSGTNGTGTAGIPLTIRFNVVRSSYANRAPIISNPGNRSTVVGTAITPLKIVASDPDDNPITLTVTGLPAGLSFNASTASISGTPTTQGISTVTATVSDNASPSLTASASFTWTVPSSTFLVQQITFIDPATDQKVMNITNGQTYNINSLPAGVNVGVEIEGYPLGSVVFGFDGNPRYKVETLPAYSLYENSGNNYLPGSLPLGTHTLTVTPYRLQDGVGEAGISKTVTFTITGTANRPPTVANPGDRTSAPNSAITPLQVVASDPDGNPITYSATGLPTGLSINTSTGVISGTPTAAGVFNVSVTVKDNASPAGTTTVTFKWTITAALAVTQIVLINAQTDQAILNITDGMTINLAQQPPQLNIGVVTTGSPIGGIVFGYNGNARYKLENLPVYGLFDNSGSNYLPGVLPLGTNTITATPYTGTNGNGTAGTGRTVTFTVINQSASASRMQTSVVVNLPPTITAPAAQTSTAGSAITPLQVVAADPENGALRYAAEGLPAGLSLDPASGLISGTPTLAGTSTVTLTVIDSGALTAVASVDWTVAVPPVPPAVNQVPTIAPISAQMSTVGTPSTLSLMASDPEGQALIYSATGLPAGLTLDSATGIVSGMPSAAWESTVALTVVDSGTPAASATLTFAWTVAEAAPPVNLAPALTPVTDQSSTEGDVIALQVVASDTEGAVTYAAMSLPAGLTLDASTGLVSGSIAAGSAATSPNQVTMTVTDAGGLSASSTFQWVVNAAP